MKFIGCKFAILSYYAAEQKSVHISRVGVQKKKLTCKCTPFSRTNGLEAAGNEAGGARDIWSLTDTQSKNSNNNIARAGVRAAALGPKIWQYLREGGGVANCLEKCCASSGSIHL